MATYTADDLRLFRELAIAVRGGQEVDNFLAVQFAQLGWLQQVSTDPLRWSITPFGEQQLV